MEAWPTFSGTNVVSSKMIKFDPLIVNHPRLTPPSSDESLNVASPTRVRSGARFGWKTMDRTEFLGRRCTERGCGVQFKRERQAPASKSRRSTVRVRRRLHCCFRCSRFRRANRDTVRLLATRTTAVARMQPFGHRHLPPAAVGRFLRLRGPRRAKGRRRRRVAADRRRRRS